jgi:hypothetical protein
MPGYSVTFTVVDEATDNLNNIQRRIRQMREPLERMSRDVQKFIDPQKLLRVSEGFKDIARTSTEAFEAMGKLVPLVGELGAATGSLTAIGKLIGDFGKLGQQLSTDATYIGTSTDRLQVMQRSLSLAGGNADDMTDAMKGLRTAMAGALSGADMNARKWFQFAHIQYEHNGVLRDTGDVMREVIPWLQKYGDHSFRLQAATSLGSSKLSDVAEQFTRSGASMDQWNASARTYLQLSEQQIQKSLEFDRAIAEITESLKGMKDAAGAAWGEGLTPFFKGIGDWLRDDQPQFEQGMKSDLAILQSLWDIIHLRWPTHLGDILKEGPDTGLPSIAGGQRPGLTPPQVPPLRGVPGPPVRPGATGSMWHQGFLQQALPYAMQASQATGIDPQLILAQAALESHYGEAAPGFNYFGIKTPTGAYATYGSMAESFAAYARTLNEPRYAAVRGAHGLEGQLAALSASPYAGDPQYAAKLRNVIAGLPSSQDLLQANFAARHPEIFGQPGTGQNMVTIHAPNGAAFTVHKAVAPQFQGFLNDLAATGYNIVSGGGYNPRMIRGGSEWSEHAYGAAIDINPKTNPMLQGALSTDLPSNVGDIAARWGLKWGGSFHDRPDPMHFEAATILPQAQPATMQQLSAPLKSSVDIAITHRNPPPGTNATATGTGDVNVAPPRVEYSQLAVI